MTAQPVTLAPHTTADNVTAGLRVAYVITRSDSIGGGHIHIRDVALALRARGGEPFVLVGGQGPFTDELRTQLRELQPDLVSTHSAKAGWLAPLAAAALNIPCIQTTHGWSFTTGVPRVAALCYSWIERIGVLSADR